MSLQTTSSPVSVSSAPATLPVTEQARRTLERLLDLGVQVVDGNLSALLGIPAALADVADGLHGLHYALTALPASKQPALGPSLAAHATRRKQLDFDELDTLVRLVATADRADLVGRRVVITALVLLSNVESDERWYRSLRARPRAA
jgi:hypothetical protein